MNFSEPRWSFSFGRRKEPAEPSKEIPRWRDIPWGSRDDLRNDILQYKPNAPDVQKTNIALFGLVGSGKSSAANTTGTIVEERIVAKAEALGDIAGTKSITKRFRIYTFRDCRFTLCDTMGIEQSQGLDLLDVPYILDGHIPDKFQFPEGRITPDTPGFIKSPTKSDRMHCVAYVVDGIKVTNEDNTVFDKFKQLRELASARDIRIVILITHNDEICPLVAKDLRTMYRSRAVFDLIKNMSALTGLPESHIFAVKNYKEEIDVNPFLEVLFLKTLKLILGFADDCFGNMDV